MAMAVAVARTSAWAWAWAWAWWCVVAWRAGAVGGAVITAPPSLVADIPTFVYNSFIGRQSLALGIGEVGVAFVSTTSPIRSPSHLNCTELDGKAVVVQHHATTSWTWQDEYDTALAVQGCGGVLMVRPVDSGDWGRDILGLQFHNRDADCCRGASGVTMPVLTAWYGDVRALKDAYTDGLHIAANFTHALPNPYDEDFFDVDALFALFRIVLPVVNFATALTALTGVWLRVAEGRKPTQRARSATVITLDFLVPCVPFDPSFNLLTFALGVEVVLCVTRGVYCAAGPIFWNGFFTWEQHMQLVNITIPTQVVQLSASLLLFDRVGIFGDERKRINPRVLGVLCVVVLAFTFADSTIRAKRLAFAEVRALSAVFLGLFILSTSSVFIWKGWGFVRALARTTNAGQSSARRRVKARFARFVMCSAVTQILEVVTILASVVFSKFYFSPTGLATIMGLLYVEITLMSVFNCAAFSPITGKGGRGSLRGSTSNHHPPAPESASKPGGGGAGRNDSVNV